MTSKVILILKNHTISYHSINEKVDSFSRYEKIYNWSYSGTIINYHIITSRVKGAKIIKQYKGEEVLITNPLQLPDPNNIEEYYEPFVIGKISFIVLS